MKPTNTRNSHRTTARPPIRISRWSSYPLQLFCPRDFPGFGPRPHCLHCPHHSSSSSSTFLTYLALAFLISFVSLISNGSFVHGLQILHIPSVKRGVDACDGCQKSNSLVHHSQISESIFRTFHRGNGNSRMGRGSNRFTSLFLSTNVNRDKNVVEPNKVGGKNDSLRNSDGGSEHQSIEVTEIAAPSDPNFQDSQEHLFDAIVNARYACTRFQRYQEPPPSGNEIQDEEKEKSTTLTKPTTLAKPTASISNPHSIRQAHQCLTLAQRAPTGFNAQPYRIILVHSQHMKERLAQYCLGRNADRVRDSDCTAVFLADREVGRDLGRYRDFLVENMEVTPTSPSSPTSRTRQPLSMQALNKIRLFILLFSSGYPLPCFIRQALSWGVRLAVSILSFFARAFHSLQKSNSFVGRWFSTVIPNIQLLPTLSSAETWSEKNTMLVAMTYILACTSRGLATCPMEGVDAGGVKWVLGVPDGGRFGVPLIVSVGNAYRRVEDGKGVDGVEDVDDVGLSHGSAGGEMGCASMSPRYPPDEVIFGNVFGKQFASSM